MATILICDNEQVLRSLVKESLAGRGYAIVEAADGDESLALARRHLPDVVVLDMMMPGKTGVEVLRELRVDPSLVAARVIMLTARAGEADRAAAAAAGADVFLAKPFSPLQLAAMVAELVDGPS